MDRTVRVRLEAAVAGFQASLARSQASVKSFGSEVAHVSRSSRQEMQTVGTAMAVAGAATLAGLGMAGKAAIDFESSFAGVRKTVDGSEAEFEALAAGMRDMSRSIPTNVHDLNAIGEAAGQLGIKKENILDFTRTMADLGETTNMSADEAATSLARLANITQMPQTEFDRLGSVIVDLGNNFATTESEITEMGQRIAGAGAQIGMSEADIMAVGAALSSLGIRAEAGGSAISKVMIDIASEVENGGDKLGTFAEVAGMSAEEFSTAFRDDATGAIGSFITGLGKMEESGGSTLGVLEDLEITEVRMRDALLRASGAGDLWAETGEVANEAWEENTALADEAAQRYETVGAKIDIARNAMTDAAITIGETFAPAIGGAADMASGLAGSIADMPGPLAGVTAGIAGLGGAASLAAGGFLLAAPRIVETKDALRTLSSQMPRTVGALRGVGTFLTGPWGMAIGGAIAAVGLFAYEQGEAARLAESMTQTLDDQTGALTDNSEAWLRDELDKREATDALETLGLSVRDVTDALMGNEDARRRVNAAIDEGLHGMGPEQEAARTLSASYNDLSTAVDESTESRRRELENAARAKDTYVDMAHALDSGLTPAEASARREMEGFTGDTENAAGAMGEGETAAGGLAGGLDAAGTAAEEAVDPVEDFTDAVRTAVGVFLDAASAEINYEAALDTMIETLGEGKLSLDRHTEAGRENEQAIIDAIEAATNHGSALIEEGESADVAAQAVKGHIGQLRQEMIDAGFAKDKVDKLLASYGATPSEIYTNIIANTADAEAAMDRLAAKLSHVTGTKHVRVEGSTNVVPKGVTRHAGGWADWSGPSVPEKLSSNEIPAVLEHGEFVVREEMAERHGPLLEAINAGRFHDTGQSGRPIEFSSPVSAPQTSGGGSVTHVTEIHLDGRKIGENRQVFDGMQRQNRRVARQTGGVGL